MTHDREIDLCGLLCPLPVLKTRKTLQAMAPGSVLRVIADDPVALIDLPHFCSEAGHLLVASDETDGVQTYLIRNGG